MHRSTLLRTPAVAWVATATWYAIRLLLRHHVEQHQLCFLRSHDYAHVEFLAVGQSMTAGLAVT